VAASLISTTRVQGLVVPDPRVSEDNLTAQDGGATDSSYTQAGAKPGVPEADQTALMTLQASGSQTDKGQIEIYTGRAGSPGLEDGGFLLRDVAAGDSTSQYSGWDGYQAITGSEVVYAGNGSAGGSLNTVARLPDGTVLLAHETAAGSLNVEQYDPSDSTWTTRVTGLSIAGAIATHAALALVYDPKAKLLLLFVVASGGRNLIMAKSDDEGFTFSVGSYHVLRSDIAATSTINEIRAAYNNDQIVLFLQYTLSGVEEVAQYASTDRGTRFDEVSSEWTVSGDLPDAIDVAPLFGGGFLFVYADGRASNPRYRSRRIGSAFEDAQNADDVVLVAQEPGGRPSVTIWQDEDAVMYAIAAIDETADTSYVTSLFRSADLGDSWEAWGGPIAELHPGSQDAELNDFSAVSTGGLCLLITKYTVPNETDSNSAVLCLFLGGHGSHTLPATDEAVGGTPATRTNFPDTQFVPWSRSDENDKPGGFWGGFEAPDQLGWTKTGAGTGSVLATLDFQTSTSSNQASYDRTTTDATVTTAVVEFEVKCTSGGATTTKDVGVELVISDYDGSPASATFTYAISVRIATTGLALYDDNNLALIDSAVVLDMTSYRKIRIALSSSGDVISWYSTHPGSAQRQEWTRGPDSTTLTNTTADVGNRVEFGNLISATAIAAWKHFGHCMWGTQWGARSDTTNALAESWTNPTDLHPRSYSALPLLAHDGVKIAAVDGPSLIAETWQIQPEHTYALSNVFPSSAPSPRRGWRSTADNVEQLISIELDPDFTSARLRGHALCVLLLESNLESVVVEKHDGGSWSTLAAITATDDWASLAFDRRGSAVIPDSGTSTTGDRYFWYGAHKGDTADLGADGLHKIRSNTEGAWIGTTTTKKPTLLLERDNLPGALGNTASGTMKIRRKDFGAIIHSYNEDDQHIRIRIPAQQTADDDYRIGTLVIGHIAVFGQQYDHGWSMSREFDTQLFRRSGGTRRARKRGPSRRVVELAWADAAVDASKVQAESPDPNFIGGQTAVDLANATPYDVVQLVEGVHEEQGGPELPVVYLSRIPTDADSTHPLSDWREFVYGRLESDIRIDNVLGDESKTELNRLNTITVREEK